MCDLIVGLAIVFLKNTGRDSLARDFGLAVKRICRLIINKCKKVDHVFYDIIQRSGLPKRFTRLRFGLVKKARAGDRICASAMSHRLLASRILQARSASE